MITLQRLLFVHEYGALYIYLFTYLFTYLHNLRLLGGDNNNHSVQRHTRSYRDAGEGVNQAA